MEGISKQYLKNSLVSIEDAPIDDAIKSAFAILVEKLIAECQELQEPWMTLDEFLKSGFCGKCWIPVMGTVIQVEYDNSGFWNGIRYLNDIGVTKVMPIHKPEPPR